MPEREAISHAEFARFVQEAQDMRRERDEAQAEIERLRSMIDQAADFWRPVARDLEHGVLTIESVRYLAQDFLAMLADPTR